ncbi:flagellar hook-length control protein FliK [Xanthobacteraceae bacterium A53D]
MSALNITAALPQTRGSDAPSGKSVNGDDGSGFGDVFRDLTRGKDEPGADGNASDEKSQSGKAQAGDTSKASGSSRPSDDLADALSLVTDRRGVTASETATLDERKANASAFEDRGEDRLQANRDETSQQSEALLRKRQAQAHQGLSTLLFGREAGETGVGGGSEDARLLADMNQTDGKASGLKREATATAPAPEGEPSLARQIETALAMPPAQPARPASEAPAAAEEEAPTPNTMAMPGAAEPEEAQQVRAQAMQINVLSRETHFAPIRTLGLNGGSAPAEATAQSATTDAAAVAEAAETTGVARPTMNARSANASKPWAPVMPSQTMATQTAAGTETRETAGTGEAEVPRTARAAGNARRETAEPNAARTETVVQQTRREDARDNVSLGRAHDVSATRAEGMAELPMTGTAGIAPGGVAVQNLPTLRQIGAAIASEVTTMGTAQAGFAGMADPANQSQGPVRLLQIQLKPDELGTVNVRMRLSSNGLEIQLRASNPETARMLERDRDALMALLKASGISADSVTIVGIDRGGSMQLTGQDAGKPFAQENSSASQAEGQDQEFAEDEDRNSRDEQQPNGGSHDEARSRSRSGDAGGGDFRL